MAAGNPKEPGREDRPKKIEVVYDGEGFLAVNKPAGVSVTADRTGAAKVSDYIERQLGGSMYFTVHRLDKPTSGVLLYAKNEDMLRQLCGYFTERRVNKTYLAIVSGPIFSETGTIRQAIGHEARNVQKMRIDPRHGKPAHTDYRVLATFGTYSLMALMPRTGRTHQLRVHMASIDLPIACDEMYGSGRGVLLSDVKPNYRLSRGKTENPLIDRLCLHAYELELPEELGAGPIVAGLDQRFLAAVKMMTKHNPEGVNAFIEPGHFERIVNGQSLGLK